jgi:hypothetical protein
VLFGPWSRPSALLVTTVATCTLLAPTVLVTGARAGVDGEGVPNELPSVNPSAEQALEVAEEALAGGPDRESPTMALRDLALQLDQLDGIERQAAHALLARPNQGAGHGDGFAAWNAREAAASRNDLGCSTDPATPICVHWTNQGADAPSPADSDDDNVPNWVETTLDEMEQVWDYEVNTLGYRRPLTDQRGSADNKGADRRFFDVYLSDIGSRYYGYCAVDDTRTRDSYRFKDRSGYCVLDEDYSKAQFPVHTPLENLQVTAAHEFFHAIQFGYDASEDIWFMEGTAAWIEDEVYTDVNDNRQYLSTSQFKHPRRSLDDNRGIGVYGTWGFIRYLTEKFGADVVLRWWQRADGSGGGADDYSLTALRRAVSSQGGRLQQVLGTFGLAISQPSTFLSEGSRFPSSTVGSFRLDRDRDTTRWQRYVLDHLSYAPVELRPGNRLQSGDRLRISVDAPGRTKHPEVRVMTVRRGGGVDVESVRLDRRGRGTATVAIGRATVRRVVLSMANTSTDLRRCFSRSTPFSCKGGIPVDDGQVYWFRATVS